MPVDERLVGLEGVAAVTVTPDRTADAYGNAGLHVFATPALVALIERAAIAALAGQLDAGEGSVGSIVRVTHQAPTPLGATITARARVRAVDGNQIWFDVEANDGTEQVGEGEHLRIVIDEARFMRRIEKKAATMAAATAGSEGSAGAASLQAWSRPARLAGESRE
jgi:fluoroacetyl-CoA thioesterase